MRGPKGMTVCRVCRKWLKRADGVEVNGQVLHVQAWLGLFLRKLASALRIADVSNFCAETAYRIGREARP